MANRIGIRLEDKNDWERRVALTPADVSALTAQGIEIWVERFRRRVFADESYAAAGARLADSVQPCEIVLGIKEMPSEYFRTEGAYLFFSHTIKGQPYNMDMLARLVERRCTLLDYEVVRDDQGRRLIFFGRYAGLAGMIDTLWTLGQRLHALDQDTPFLHIQPSHRYADLEEAKEAVREAGKRIAETGLPESLAPLTIGITGYGHVSQGAQEIVDLLPVVQIAPADLARYVRENAHERHRIAKVVYREEDLVAPQDPGRPFELQDYYDHGDAYRSIFEPHLQHLTVLVNAIFWNEKYPKLADADALRRLFSASTQPRLLVVGDITCDVDGSLACTVRDTEPGDPVYVYDPETRRATSGFQGEGLATMAVGNLPCELPREASGTFSTALTPFIPALAALDLNASFEQAELPSAMRRAVILWRGEFTPEFEYMRKFVE